MKKQTIYTLLVIALVLSFFVTPLGDYSKILLNRVFALSPTIIGVENRAQLPDYDWRLKDAQWNLFNFTEAEDKVVFITFWRSWHMPSQAQLKDVESLYTKYKGKVKFYVISNEERGPVEEFILKSGYTFPVTYEIVGDSSPIEILKPPGSYIIDKNGFVAVHQTAIADWDNDSVDALLTKLIAE